MPAASDHRLSHSIVPSHYRITLEPDLDAATFAGSVVIDVWVSGATDVIVCNSAELHIGAAELVERGGARHALSVDYDPERERVTFRLPEAVAPGNYELHADFDGTLNDQLRGFYRSTYRDEDGKDHVIATTQFEATDARRAFPCWDEPDFKATFDVVVVVPAGMTAISCTSVRADDALGDGRRRVEFGRTIPLSTYLLAFVVGELEATAPVDVAGVPLRVVHVPGKGHLTSFALEFGAFSLAWFAEYYDIPYPGDKLDLIAIPDFAAGAMENLGAVTFRESVLLVDPETATQAELSRVAEVIAHELAHMWFGNLVTMKWWNGLWLKEAFATFMEVLCVEAFRPEWKSWLAFAAERDGAMETDSLKATRPIEFPVTSPDEADEMFDDITYGKGAAVLRMLQQFLGADTFRQGISDYLAAHAYGNADTPDLWAALDAVSEHPVDDMMNGWIYRGGFPAVTVERKPDGYLLDQQRFMLEGSDATRWKIPLLLSGATGDSSVMLEGEMTVAGDDTFTVNRGGHGVYRVRYSPELAADVAMRAQTFDPYERFALVSDSWAGVLAGQVAAVDYLSFVSALRDEPEAQIWDAMYRGLDELDRIVSSESAPSFRQFIATVVRPAVSRAGWAAAPRDSDLERRRRGSLLRLMGVLARDGATVERALGVFERVVAGDHVEGEVAAAATAIVAAHAGSDDYAKLDAARKAATTPQEEVRYLRAMAAVPSAECAEITMTMVLDGRIRTHHIADVVARLIGNRAIGPVAWRLLAEHWEDTIGLLPPFVRRYVLGFIHLRSEPEVGAEIASWLAAHPLPAAAKSTAQQLERLSARIRLRTRESHLRAPAV